MSRIGESGGCFRCLDSEQIDIADRVLAGRRNLLPAAAASSSREVVSSPKRPLRPWQSSRVTAGGKLTEKKHYALVVESGDRR
ncbi:hypothetical protein OPV22_004444 [Ensete ventricosum]|uniref:Uncharacterized protein n=1 Tax=Ensete ventricosum TaxID=4639 RepID=A0AAV8S3S1_ENSVE|nr:hypothetical protein OPV22_004444 [Ensete ventricosum]